MFLTFFLILGMNVEVNAQEKLLDKIIAVINNRVVSLSELNRVKDTLGARREISPFIYTQDNYKDSEILETIIQSQVIRDKISTQGYIVSDDHVESRIKMTEEKLGLNRESLLEFLKQKSVTFEEYFEIIREAMEYNLFATRVIAPLITVTDQELKNEFYKRNANNKALSFVYDLVDFSIPAKVIPTGNKEEFVRILKDYQITGRLPKDFSALESNNLDGIKGDSLAQNLSQLLENSQEGSFSLPIDINNAVHVFYVKSKDLIESQGFMKAKEQIENDLFNTKSKSLSKNWFDREYPNYHIKRFL